MSTVTLKSSKQADWQQYRDVISQYYIQDKPNPVQLRATMLEVYGFYATQYQFIVQLDKWNLLKKRPARVFDTDDGAAQVQPPDQTTSREIRSRKQWTLLARTSESPHANATAEDGHFGCEQPFTTDLHDGSVHPHNVAFYTVNCDASRHASPQYYILRPAPIIALDNVLLLAPRYIPGATSFDGPRQVDDPAFLPFKLAPLMVVFCNAINDGIRMDEEWLVVIVCRLTSHAGESHYAASGFRMDVRTLLNILAMLSTTSSGHDSLLRHTVLKNISCLVEKRFRCAHPLKRRKQERDMDSETAFDVPRQAMARAFTALKRDQVDDGLEILAFERGPIHLLHRHTNHDGLGIFYAINSACYMCPDGHYGIRDLNVPW